jgi:fructose-1,6-bisphosphatase/inositol monophosphatase family enzyme
MDQAAEDFAVSLARRAGEIMRSNFTLGAKRMWKEDDSPLTATDEAINEMVIDAIRETYPDHAVIGEEESFGDTANAEWVWVCDPVDGTLPFSHGTPTFAFSLGLAHRGKPVLGVIYDPYLDRMVTAREGLGARLNGEPVRVGDFAGWRRTVVGLEMSAASTQTTRTVLRERGACSVSYWSFVYEAMLLAVGEFAGVVYASDCPWDCCAVDVIIREAGGTVSNIAGDQNLYNGKIKGFVAAASPQLHRELLELVQADM